MWGLRTNKRTPPNSQMRERRGQETEKGVRRRPLPATRRAGLGTDPAAAGAPRGARGRGSRDQRGSLLSAVVDASRAGASQARRIQTPSRCAVPQGLLPRYLSIISRFFPKGTGLCHLLQLGHTRRTVRRARPASHGRTRAVCAAHMGPGWGRAGVSPRGEEVPLYRTGSRGGRRGRRTCARGLRVSAEGAAAPGDRDREESGGPLGPLVAEGASRGVTPTSAQKHSPSALK